jgi:hypothetical protein
MGRIDPSTERHRLEERYARMSDLELEKVGRDPLALTSWAREALGAEMIRRGLKWPPDTLATSIQDRVGRQKLKILGKHQTYETAVTDMDALKDTGVESFCCEETTAKESEGISDFGILIMVRDKDFEPAKRTLHDRDELASMVGDSEETKVPSKPVVLRQYRDITAAMVDKTTLDAAGIECYLYDDNLVRLDWFISNAIGGVKLVVAENTAEEAAKILAEAERLNREDSVSG